MLRELEPCSRRYQCNAHMPRNRQSCFLTDGACSSLLNGAPWLPDPQLPARQNLLGTNALWEQHLNWTTREWWVKTSPLSPVHKTHVLYCFLKNSSVEFSSSVEHFDFLDRLPFLISLPYVCWDYSATDYQHWNFWSQDPFLESPSQEEQASPCCIITSCTSHPTTYKVEPSPHTHELLGRERQSQCSGWDLVHKYGIV